MTTARAQQLYGTLKPLGITRAQLKSLLPDWWDDNAADSPDGSWELVLLISRRLSLDATALSKGVATPKGAVTSLAYKHRGAIDPSQLLGSSLIAASLAQAVIAGVRKPFTRPAADTAVAHQAVREAGKGVADFDALLAHCWDLGIPVIPLPNLPVGLRKMDGAAMMLRGRPVIVISRRNDSKSWLSFILAHELGHIARGHLKPDSAIIDVALQQEATYASESGTDRQETEADEFALGVLGGQQAEAVASQWNARESSVNLAVAARKSGQALGIAPGHLLLRHAFRTKQWPAAIAASKFLHEDIDAQVVVAEALAKHIDADALADDLKDLVTKVTGVVLS